MSRHYFYVDGFNMYYALKQYPQFKWLNYRQLAQSKIGAKDTLEGVYYFSAYVTWRPDNYRRHQNYVKALRWAGVEFVPGRFKKKDIRCHLCKKSFQTHEEKQTDVNIALAVLEDAYQNKFDTAVIVSADIDLLPVMTRMHASFPDKKIGVMFPINSNSFELRQNADFHLKMSQNLLRDCQFPDLLQIGTIEIRRPEGWK